MKKEQLKLENQRKLLEKLLFMTICPEFNDGGVTEAVSIVLFKFLWLSNFYSCFVVSLISFRCFGGFLYVFRWFRWFRWFRIDGFVPVFPVLVHAN